MMRAMEAFETPFVRNARMSSSLPSSFDLPRAPLGRPRRLPRALAPARPSLVRSTIRSPFDLRKQPEEHDHRLGLEILLALESNGLLDRHEVHALVDQAVNDVQDLAETPAQTRQLADDEPVAPLQRLDLFHQFSPLGGMLRRASGLDELVYRQSLLLGVVEDGQPLLVEVLSSGRHPKIGNRRHGHSMKS